MKRLLLALPFLAPCLSTPAHADVLLYLTNGTLADGGTFSGTLQTSPTRGFIGGNLTVLDAGNTYLFGPPSNYGYGNDSLAYYTNAAGNGVNLWFPYGSIITDAPVLCYVPLCPASNFNFFSLNYFTSTYVDRVTSLTLSPHPPLPSPPSPPASSSSPPEPSVYSASRVANLTETLDTHAIIKIKEQERLTDKKVDTFAPHQHAKSRPNSILLKTLSNKVGELGGYPRKSASSLRQSSLR